MKTLKSVILSSSLLLSIKSVEARTWHNVVDHALYQHIAVDTARYQLRVESDPFLETPHNSGIHNGLQRDTSPPSASPTSAPCREGSIHYQMNMYDTSGNGWQGTAIQVIGIKDQDTLHTSVVSNDPDDSSTYTTTTRLNTNEGNGYVSLSNTVQFGSGALLSDTEPTNLFPLGKVFETALTRGSSDHADICLVPRRCYDIVVHRGSKLEEVSWNLTAMVDNFEQEETAYIEGGAPMYCKFSIPDANGEVFCPIECSEEIPEQYTKNDATFADLLHPPVEAGNDGGFSAIYHQFAGKEKDENDPKGKYSMFLAIDGEEGEDGEVQTKPLAERPEPPAFDVDNIGLPSPPTEEEEDQDGTIEEEEDEDSPAEIENEDSPTEEDPLGETLIEGAPTTEEGEGISTETEVGETLLEEEKEEEPTEENIDTPHETPAEIPAENEATLVEEGQDVPVDEGDQDIPPVVEDQGSPIETEISNTPADEVESGTLGESGSFIPLNGEGVVAQSAQHTVVNEEYLATPNEDDDSLASQGLLEEDSSLPLTSEVRSGDLPPTSEVRSGEDIQLSMDKTLAIPEYSGTMQFQEEEPKVDVSESLPVDPAAQPADRSSAPVKTDTFHMLLRHGGKR